MAAHRNRTRITFVAGGAALGMLALGGCGGADLSDAPVEKRSFPFSGDVLTIDARNSDVELVPADVQEVEVARQIDGWVVMGTGPEPVWKLSDGRLTLGVKCTAALSDCAARHEVRVPRGVAVTLDGDNGAVTASGFTTALRIGADNGSVTVRHSSGPLDLHSDNGTITTAGIASKTVAARANNGAVRLGLSAVPDRVDTRSDNGQIIIELPSSDTEYAVTAKSGNGSVDVDVPTDDRSTHVLKARSDNGHVTVRSVN